MKILNYVVDYLLCTATLVHYSMALSETDDFGLNLFIRTHIMFIALYQMLMLGSRA